MSISNIIKQVEQVQSNLNSQAKIFLENDKKEILDLVRIDQLFSKGEDADGEKLIPYTSFTKAAKRSEGKDPNVVTLLDDEDYYRGFDLTLIADDVLNIFSRDGKAKELSEKYGSRIDDLSDSNEEKVNSKLEEKLVTWMLSKVKI
tara:strand:+ start:614 stop:1051 length:438 start_codon:yes stop_codon:yes gene_type:complete